MKFAGILLFLFTASSFQKSFTQECTVDNPSLRGAYTGDCKKGKANGKGKSVGIDVYEGDFKAGLPDGSGTYTWSNGNSFTGQFVKGVKQGKGVLTIKKPDVQDSVVEGYWKNDAYIGKYEQPYSVYFKSKLVTEFEVSYKKDAFSQITFFVTNTSGGTQSTFYGYSPRLKVDEVQLNYGRYGRLMVNDIHTKKTESILSDVTYPIRMKVLIDKEEVEMEFREPGSYVIDIHINQ
jgi:hypothetical protein